MSDASSSPTPSGALRAWTFIAEQEGGGVLHTDSLGLTTKWGFAQKYNPDVDVATLTYVTAFDRFLRLYWQPLQCEKLPPPIAIALADYAFNAGADDAIPDLQKAASARLDGKMGPKTISAISGRYNQKPERLVNDYLSYRCLKYARSGRSEDNRGWYVRVLKLRGLLEKEMV